MDRYQTDGPIAMTPGKSTQTHNHTKNSTKHDAMVDSCIQYDNRIDSERTHELTYVILVILLLSNVYMCCLYPQTGASPNKLTSTTVRMHVTPFRDLAFADCKTFSSDSKMKPFSPIITVIKHVLVVENELYVKY